MVYIHQCTQTASLLENGKGIGGVEEQKYSCGSSPLEKKTREERRCGATAVQIKGGVIISSTLSKRDVYWEVIQTNYQTIVWNTRFQPHPWTSACGTEVGCAFF